MLSLAIALFLIGIVFASLAASTALSALIGTTWAYLVIGGIYLTAGVALMAFAARAMGKSRPLTQTMQQVAENRKIVQKVFQ